LPHESREMKDASKEDGRVARPFNLRTGIRAGINRNL
jgi:hypothetical protein